jgi:hypothetical protein
MACAALAIGGLIASQASADTLDPSGLHWSTTILGTSTTDPINHHFTATVDAAYYASTDAGYSAYASAFTLANTGAGFDSTDAILAYRITNVDIAPDDDTLMNFSVQSGSKIDAVGFLNDAGSSPALLAQGLGTFKANYSFNIPEGAYSGILLFAAKGAPTLQMSTLKDLAEGDNLVLSVAGPAGGGTPLPMPAAACGGAALFSMMGFARRRRVVA